MLALLYQVTDSEEELRRATYAELLDTYYDINQMQVEQPEVWRVMYPLEYPGDVEPTTLSEAEQFAVGNTYFIMSFFERIYLLYRDGDIEEERWKAWESWIDYSLTTSPLFQQVWDESCGVHHVAFMAYIEENYDDGTCEGADNPGAAPGGTPAAIR